MRKDQEPFDEYEDDDNDRPHKIKKDSQYFDDELPQKAVSGLFKGAEKTPMVKGYEDPEDDDETEGVAPPRKRRIRSPESEEDGFVRGFERKPAPASTLPPPASKHKVREGSDEEAFTLYRKKKNIAVNAKPAVKVQRGPTSASRPVERPARQQAVSRDDEAEQSYEDDDYDAFKEKYKNREYIPSPKQPKAAGQKAAAYGGPDYDDYEDDGDASAGLKVALAVVSCIFLIILAVLVFKINSTSAQLKEANEKIAAVDSSDVELETLKMEKDALKDERDRLLAENEELKSSAVSVPPEGGAGTNGDETNEETASTSNGERVHTVASGDTLTKISQQYYGNTNQYEKIKQANNLTSNNISVGQRLKIPD